MAGYISFQEHDIVFNNRQFLGSITFAAQLAEKMAVGPEKQYLAKMQDLVDNYWPGMCLNVEHDFPDIEEKKFWAKIFFETAREVFERKIGRQENLFWQTQRIFQLYGTGNLFEKAVREVEPRWSPDIRDYREFTEWANKH